MEARKQLPAIALCIHSCIAFAVSVLLLVTKWFPYGTPTQRLREWLYQLF